MNSLACCYLFKDKDKEKANVPMSQLLGDSGGCGVRELIGTDHEGFGLQNTKMNSIYLQYIVYKLTIN